MLKLSFLLSFIRKLTVLDYLILLVIAAAVFYFSLFVKASEENMIVTVISRETPLYLTNNFKKGDFEKNPFGDKTLEVLDKTLYPSRTENTTTRDMFLEVKLKAQKNQRSGGLEYKNKVVNVGSPIELQLNSGIVNGVIIRVSSNPKKLIYKIITVRSFAQTSEFADQLVVGNGDAEILQLVSKEVVPSDLRPNLLFPTEQPITLDQNKDIIMKIKILGEQSNNQFLFANQKPILIGDIFSFNVGNVYVKNALITDIDE